MKKMVLALLVSGAAIAAANPAAAREGCGRGFHRGPYGHCRANMGPGYGAPGVVLRIGTFYPGRGYWDGRRYWQRRERWHGGWRYR